MYSSGRYLPVRDELGSVFSRQEKKIDVGGEKRQKEKIKERKHFFKKGKNYGRQE